MRRFMAIAVTSGVLFTVTAMPAAAVPIVDQSFTGTWNAQGILGDECQ